MVTESGEKKKTKNPQQKTWENASHFYKHLFFPPSVHHAALAAARLLCYPVVTGTKKSLGVGAGGRNESWAVTSSRCRSGWKKVLLFLLGVPEHRSLLGMLQCCPVPLRLSAAGSTPALISKSSLDDAFESWPWVQCALYLLLAEAGP